MNLVQGITSFIFSIVLSVISPFHIHCPGFSSSHKANVLDHPILVLPFIQLRSWHELPWSTGTCCLLLMERGPKGRSYLWFTVYTYLVKSILLKKIQKLCHLCCGSEWNHSQDNNEMLNYAHLTKHRCSMHLRVTENTYVSMTKYISLLDVICINWTLYCLLLSHLNKTILSSELYSL